MDGLVRKSGMDFFKRLLGGHADGHGSGPMLQAALGARVLVVDDSPTICAVLGKMLGQEGYVVIKATDGKTAIELVRSEEPALIFLDVVMPGMNGFTVLRTLRHDPLVRDVPIIMISGNQQATEQFYLQRYGADDFMKKPFGGDDVYRRISQLVAAGRLAARKPSDVIDATVIASSSVSHDAIPDIAMPDAAHAQEAASANAQRKVPVAA
ncbi:response regulator [Rhodanobacter sp. L36]|uniref:response regulator n=1 Tax=Rhodanobacter sp. L36 TaxID=1747221 RepID=UPI00131A77BD|nr:response regulator [Rhodanobacter sp. L36]